MAADLVLEIAERTAVGRPATLVRALVTVANQNPPLAPLHRPCDPILAAEQKIGDLKVQIAPKPDQPRSLAIRPSSARSVRTHIDSHLAKCARVLCQNCVR
ncbi:MAG TPA: hypothetical protein VHH35_10610 [Pyrinomonadaceae bacterium]|nr:hypothetical protein [Pyrinomonadaceae bacterium]